MTFSDVLFYYSTGTGNSYQICLWARDYYLKKGIRSQLIPIEKAVPREDIVDVEKTLVFFVMPTHAFTAPWSMLKFCLLFPRFKNLRFVSIASKGGFLLGKVLIPGINGSGNYWISSLLTMKGLLPEAMASINMPSNWTTLHPAHNEKNVLEIYRRAQLRVEKLLNAIEKGRGRFLTLNNVSEFFWGFILFPVAFFYYLYGKIFLAKTYFVNDKCNSCGDCVKNCPSSSIVKTSQGLFWKYTCENCMRCHNSCPQKAIQGSYSWGALLFIVVSLFALTGWLALILFYGVVIGGYYVLFWLSSRPEGRRLLMLTTPTPFYRRFRAPEIDVKKLNSRQ